MSFEYQSRIIKTVACVNLSFWGFGRRINLNGLGFLCWGCQNCWDNFYKNGTHFFNPTDYFRSLSSEYFFIWFSTFNMMKHDVRYTAVPPVSWSVFLLIKNTQIVVTVPPSFQIFDLDSFDIDASKHIQKQPWLYYAKRVYISCI